MTRSHATAILRPFLVVALALGMALALYAVAGYDTEQVVRGVYQGSLGSQHSVSQSVRWAVPLLLIALGVGVAFRAGYFNVGAQGQLYIGSLAALATTVGLEGLPSLIVVPAALLSGIVSGALWSLIPGVLRIRFGADEVVTSLMLNFIAALVLEWVASGPLKSGTGSGKAAVTRTMSEQYRISDSTGVSVPILFICAAAVLATWYFVQRTQVGLEIRVVGRNPTMAAWQGVRSSRVGALAFAFSGATAGLAGGVEALGPAGSLHNAYSPQVGFMAIVVALVGGLSAFGILVAAAFFGALRAATLFLPTVSDLPQSGIEIIVGLVALLITAATFPSLRRRVRPRSRPGHEEPHPETVPLNAFLGSTQ